MEAGNCQVDCLTCVHFFPAYRAKIDASSANCLLYKKNNRCTCKTTCIPFKKKQDIEHRHTTTTGLQLCTLHTPLNTDDLIVPCILLIWPFFGLRQAVAATAVLSVIDEPQQWATQTAVQCFLRRARPACKRHVCTVYKKKRNRTREDKRCINRWNTVKCGYHMGHYGLKEWFSWFFPPFLAAPFVNVSSLPERSIDCP